MDIPKEIIEGFKRQGAVLKNMGQGYIDDYNYGNQSPGYQMGQSLQYGTPLGIGSIGVKGALKTIPLVGKLFGEGAQAAKFVPKVKALIRPIDEVRGPMGKMVNSLGKTSVGINPVDLENIGKVARRSDAGYIKNGLADINALGKDDAFVKELFGDYVSKRKGDRPDDIGTMIDRILKEKK